MFYPAIPARDWQKPFLLLGFPQNIRGFGLEETRLSRRHPRGRRGSRHEPRRLGPALPGTRHYADVGAGDRPFGPSFGTRSEVFGRNGAAASSHPLGTLAGIEILKKGGSAVDAAIAINAALGFLEPTANGIGVGALMESAVGIVRWQVSGRDPVFLCILDVDRDGQVTNAEVDAG